MHLYGQIYEFAASAGAFEGFVFGKTDLTAAELENWVGHLVQAYGLLPVEVRQEFQPLCDRTLGRAVQSITPVLGGDHELIGKLRSMITGPLPGAPDDFQKKKWFEQ